MGLSGSLPSYLTSGDSLGELLLGPRGVTEVSVLEQGHLAVQQGYRLPSQPTAQPVKFLIMPR